MRDPAPVHPDTQSRLDLTAAGAARFLAGREGGTSLQGERIFGASWPLLPRGRADPGGGGGSSHLWQSLAAGMLGSAQLHPGKCSSQLAPSNQVLGGGGERVPGFAGEKWPCVLRGPSPQTNRSDTGV